MSGSPGQSQSKVSAEKKARRRQSSRSLHRQSESFVEPIRELLMLRIGLEIEKRKWTQVQAARFLGASQPRISNLIRGQSDNFTIDGLVHWIGLLGLELELKIDTVGGGSAQNLFSWLDEVEHAIPFYTKAIASNPACAENYWRRAGAYQKRKQFELAIGDLTMAMELDPTLKHLRLNRAQAFVSLGQMNSAFLDCEQLVKLKPSSALLSWTYVTRAAALQALNRIDEALEDLQKAVDAAPNMVAPFYHRGLLFESLGNKRAAQKDFSRVLELEPNHIEAQLRSVNIRKKNGAKSDEK